MDNQERQGYQAVIDALQRKLQEFGTTKLGSQIGNVPTTEVGLYGGGSWSAPDITKAPVISPLLQRLKQANTELEKQYGKAYTVPRAVGQFGADVATYTPKVALKSAYDVGNIISSPKYGGNEKLVRAGVASLPALVALGTGGIANKVTRGMSVATPLARIARSAVSGGAVGGLIGGTGALSSGVEYNKPINQTALDVLGGTGQGAVSGAVLGALFGGAGEAKNVITKKIRDAEWNRLHSKLKKLVDKEGGWMIPNNELAKRIYPTDTLKEDIKRYEQLLKKKATSTGQEGSFNPNAQVGGTPTGGNREVLKFMTPTEQENAYKVFLQSGSKDTKQGFLRGFSESIFNPKNGLLMETGGNVKIQQPLRTPTGGTPTADKITYLKYQIKKNLEGIKMWENNPSRRDFYQQQYDLANRELNKILPKGTPTGGTQSNKQNIKEMNNYLETLREQLDDIYSPYPTRQDQTMSNEIKKEMRDVAEKIRSLGGEPYASKKMQETIQRNIRAINAQRQEGSFTPFGDMETYKQKEAQKFLDKITDPDRNWTMDDLAKNIISRSTNKDLIKLSKELLKTKGQYLNIYDKNIEDKILSTLERIAKKGTVTGQEGAFNPFMEIVNPNQKNKDIVNATIRALKDEGKEVISASEIWRRTGIDPKVISKVLTESSKKKVSEAGFFNPSAKIGEKVGLNQLEGSSLFLDKKGNFLKVPEGGHEEAVKRIGAENVADYIDKTGSVRMVITPQEVNLQSSAFNNKKLTPEQISQIQKVAGNKRIVVDPGGGEGASVQYSFLRPMFENFAKFKEVYNAIGTSKIKSLMKKNWDWQLMEGLKDLDVSLKAEKTQGGFFRPTGEWSGLVPQDIDVQAVRRVLQGKADQATVDKILSSKMLQANPELLNAIIRLTGEKAKNYLAKVNVGENVVQLNQRTMGTGEGIQDKPLRQIIAHELQHIIQDKGGKLPTTKAPFKVAWGKRPWEQEATRVMTKMYETGASKEEITRAFIDLAGMFALPIAGLTAYKAGQKIPEGIQKIVDRVLNKNKE